MSNLIDALDKLPLPRHPNGLIQAIRALDKASRDTSGLVEQVYAVQSSRLPDVWIGYTAEKAEDAIFTVVRDIVRTTEVFTRAQHALARYAEAIDRSIELHTEGMTMLRSNLAITGNGALAVPYALPAGVAVLVSAYELLTTAEIEIADELHSLAAEAHGHALKSKELEDLDRLSLGLAGVSENVLTKNAAERSMRLFKQLGAKDHARFKRLLQRARSPEERAYLLKALAAGRTVDQIEIFDRRIHVHGDDPNWLENYLTPPVHHNYRAYLWRQDELPTCAALSTLVAEAMIDPSYTLYLTTGNLPDKSDATSDSVMRDRIRKEQLRLYDQGRRLISSESRDGLTIAQDELIANNKVGARTGQFYLERPVNSHEDRRSVLSEIRRAIDNGLPVPFAVSDRRGGHEMLVVGHDDTRGLQIYNPWGMTEWIPEDRFVNGQMDQLETHSSVHVPAMPYNVLLPHGIAER